MKVYMIVFVITFVSTLLAPIAGIYNGNLSLLFGTIGFISAMILGGIENEDE